MSESETASVASTENRATALLDQAVTAALGAGITHSDIERHIRQFILTQNEHKPKRKVLYNVCHGGFGINDNAWAFIKSKCPNIDFEANGMQTWADGFRCNPDVIAAIIDLGKEACARIPFVLEDMLVYECWDLGTHFQRESDCGASQDVELVEAKKKFTQLYPGIRTRGGGDFEEYAKAHPDTWMEHKCFGYSSMAFAHYLKESDREKYLAPYYKTAPKSKIWEMVGLACASGGHSILAIEEVPAVVEYHIDEYDGLEDVVY